MSRYASASRVEVTREEVTRYGGIVKLEIDYAEPGPLTGLEGLVLQALQAIRDDPVQVCTPVHLLVSSSLTRPGTSAWGKPAWARGTSALRPGSSARCWR